MHYFHAFSGPFRLAAAMAIAGLIAIGVTTSMADQSVAVTVPSETPYGVDAEYRPLRVHWDPAQWHVTGSKRRVLLIASETVGPAVSDTARWFHTSIDPVAVTARQKYALAAITDARLKRWSDFPPSGDYYGNASDPSAAYLWRWLGMAAPDLVVIVDSGEQPGWQFASANGQPSPLADHFNSLAPRRNDALAEDHLATQLVQSAACETGSILAIVATLPSDANGQTPPAMLQALVTHLAKADLLPPSPAAQVLRRRLDRHPIEVAAQLSLHYGHDLNQVAYIPALALVGRLRLAQLSGKTDHRRDVERIVQPYVRGEKTLLPKSGSELAGHLIFGELAEDRGDSRYLELARLAADFALDENGLPRPLMPYHNEMSDALFMGGPILTQVARLTGETKYWEAAIQHTRQMRQLVLRSDGLYRHSPLDETAWGRGNGFPALGLALMASDYPADHPDREEILDALRSHLAVLLEHQDASGCWHQIVDRAESYREFTSTCMITFAMVRGVRQGWLDQQVYQSAILRGWEAIKLRAPENGRLVDVCAGTGKQRNAAAYFDRPAILGRDARGGAMGLLVATEIAAWLESK